MENGLLRSRGGRPSHHRLCQGGVLEAHVVGTGIGTQGRLLLSNTGNRKEDRGFQHKDERDVGGGTPALK